jgi:hypothetical protein
MSGAEREDGRQVKTGESGNARGIPLIAKNAMSRGKSHQRCDNCIVLNAALAAEGAALAQKRLFPQPVQPCR